MDIIEPQDADFFKSVPVAVRENDGKCGICGRNENLKKQDDETYVCQFCDTTSETLEAGGEENG